MLRVSAVDFDTRLEARFGGRVRLVLVSYSGMTNPVMLACKHHGVYTMTCATDALVTSHGCASCARESGTRKRTYGIEDFKAKARITHGGKYDYSKAVYINAKNKIEIGCKKHGKFWQKAGAHIGGKGCRECAYDATSIRARSNTSAFISKAIATHGTAYDYSDTKYVTAKGKVCIKCPKGHVFMQTPNDHLTGYGCPSCSNSVSSKELKLQDRIAIEFPNVLLLLSQRGIMNDLPTLELDIYIPEHKLAIEVNGLYYHSDKFKHRTYHYDKSLACKKMGITLMHISEYDIDNKLDIIISMLRCKMHKITHKIYARKCVIKDVSYQQANIFYASNHLQGRVYGSHVSTGLYYDNMLVSCMSFGSVRNNGKVYLTRFASLLNHRVAGGFSKLLAHYRKANITTDIYSIADMSYSYGNVYKSNGWAVIAAWSKNSINYKYVYRDKLYNKSWGMRSALAKRFQLCRELLDKDRTISERSLINAVGGIYRYYDAGKETYMLESIENNKLA